MKEETAGSLWRDLGSVKATPKGLSRRQHRRMGLTRFGIFRAVRVLQASPEWDANAPLSLISADVIGVLATQQSTASAWEAIDPGFDWESIMAFIEKILPIILKLLAIFGAM